ncbi:MAG: prepilin-type N-terminal cleavage/methylation domain-containing protein [Alphaproteobacteria bacterium]|nr:prepilin-type N-terminal cleavage/methylation domain-containing protein [Alphaproteobacteria bacterium]
MTAERIGGRGGFTLIEVLVAFVILALFLGAMMPTLSAGITTSRAGSDTITATGYAQSLIAGVGVEGRITTGVFTDTLEQPRFSSRLEVRPYGPEPPETDGAQSFEVIARVSWREGGRERSVSLATLRFGSAR